jgi:hypothetical protein
LSAQRREDFELARTKMVPGIIGASPVMLNLDDNVPFSPR